MCYFYVFLEEHRFNSLQVLLFDAAMWRSDLWSFKSFFFCNKELLVCVFFVLLLICLTFFFSFFLSRWRGALHHSSYKDDDGRLVDVCPYCHLLVYCQSSSLPHHHTHRELHTVSIQQISLLEIVFKISLFQKLLFQNWYCDARTKIH